MTGGEESPSFAGLTGESMGDHLHGFADQVGE
jgi:hypothetical protein